MYIYIIGSDKSPYKIGFSKTPQDRLKSLQTGNFNKLNIYYTEEISESKVKFIEKQIHNNLRHRRVKGEWFNINLEEAILEVKYCRMKYEEA